MSNMRLDPVQAADLDARLWDWIRKRYVRDKDMSAALDVLKHYAQNNYMLPMHGQVAKEVLMGQQASEPSSAPPAPEPIRSPAPMSSAADRADPAAVLERLRKGGMLRGRNGMKAVSLLEQKDHWSDAQRRFASDIASSIQKSAIVFVAVRDHAGSGVGGRFFESLVECFDEWGSYTPKQLETACASLENQTGHDPLKDAFGRSNPDQVEMFEEPKKAADKKQGPEGPDDIPF